MSKENTWWSVSGLVYPSTGNLNETLNLLIQNGFNGYASPLHEPDDKEKLTHYHINVVRPIKAGLTLKRWRDLFDVCKLVNGYVQVNDYPIKAARYLLHLDQPLKQQFLNYEVHEFESQYSTDNPVLIYFGQPPDYNQFILMSDNTKKVKDDIDKIYSDIINWCNDNNCLNYASLMNYAISCRTEWTPIIRKNCNSIIAYMRSLEYAYGKSVNVRDKFSDSQERKVISIYSGRSSGSLSSNDIDCLVALTEDGVI